ncbi:MAG: hypothetical protein K1X78_19170 [Verrucomicrobiaceae bacterium]|nr:hypothetical protein [Verrucomicrobiaceae bacterium]
MKPPRPFLAAVVHVVLALAAFPAGAHPEPDIPVRTQFMKDGACTVTIELDPRCFVAEAGTTPYTVKRALEAMTPERKDELRKLARDLIKTSIEFVFEPGGKVEPEFGVEFSGINEAPLKTDEDPVMLICTWKTKTPAGATGWRLKAMKEAKFAVIFRNYLEGVEQPRFSVLFPGETSFLFELGPAGK